jgi:hypothetical protein
MATAGISAGEGHRGPAPWSGPTLSVGVCAEAVAVRVMVGPVPARLAPAWRRPLTQRAIPSSTRRSPHQRHHARRSR